MTIIDAIIQGVVQGITEFLPISSDGHLSLVQHFSNVTGEGSLLFTCFLHIGTLLAVFCAFYKTIWEMVLELFKAIKDIFTGKFSFKSMSSQRKMLVMLIVACLPLLLLFIPIGGGNSLKDLITSTAEDDDIILEGFFFLITAFFLILATRIGKSRNLRNDINTKGALFVGVAQVLATLPGVSRSGSTISSGIISGVSKEYMVKFSFVLGIPAILAGTLLEYMDVKDLPAVQNYATTSDILVGVFVSAVVGFFAIKALQWIIRKNHLDKFGYYCLILGILVIAEGIYEKAAGQNIFQAMGIMR